MDEAGVRALIGEELAKISDEKLKRTLNELWVAPRACLLDWDYGHPHTEFSEPRYPGFIVAEFPESGTGIAFSEYGSGPTYPWVLLWLKRPGYGMDSQWFASLEAAFRESMAWDEPAPPGYEVE
jgi:hypothetical protein